MFRLLLVDPWPLWLALPLLALLIWRGGRLQALIPWAILGAALVSLAGGQLTPSATWPLFDQWVGTRLWIKLPLLLTGAFCLGAGLHTLRDRVPPLAAGVAAVLGLCALTAASEVLL
ncbi:MAG: hypothetical protein VX899_17890 [Myxococcota bacterium]|nr:hypothetical protein [Myxococcota bacterium]